MFALEIVRDVVSDTGSGFVTERERGRETVAATELCSSSALVDSRSDKNLDLLFLSFKITLCWKLNKLQIGQHFELKWVERFASFEMMTL